ncbi:MAG: Na+/H+ antiporter NhaC family protein [Evtepia gabavorous]
MLATGATAPTELLANMGSGAAGMYETAMVAILVSALCALIRAHGGFDALLNGIRRVFHGKKGGQLGMGLLVGTMDIATANNTVAIVMANPIAKEMSQDYGISPKDRLPAGHLLLHLPGYPPLRRPDAGGPLRRQ